MTLRVNLPYLNRSLLTACSRTFFSGRYHMPTPGGARAALVARSSPGTCGVTTRVRGTRCARYARGGYAHPVRAVRGALAASSPAPLVRTARGTGGRLLVRVAGTYRRGGRAAEVPVSAQLQDPARPEAHAGDARLVERPVGLASLPPLARAAGRASRHVAARTRADNVLVVQARVRVRVGVRVKVRVGVRVRVRV